EARACVTQAPDDTVSTYCTAVNPSARRSSSATNWGARQTPPSLISLIWVVSGGGSAVATLGCSPSHDAVPTKVKPSRNLRRLNRRAWWALMDTSLPDAD